VIAEALSLLGVERALVVQGEPGIDEISISGRTRWLEVTPRGVSEGAWTHPHLNVPYAELPAGEAAANAELFGQLVSGGGSPGLRALVAANAAAALDLWRDRPVLADAATLGEAEELLTRGAAKLAFERHRMEARAEEAKARNQAKG
jgi:anthranilate phosphoribosyltransferase